MNRRQQLVDAVVTVAIHIHAALAELIARLSSRP